MEVVFFRIVNEKDFNFGAVTSFQSYYRGHMKKYFWFSLLKKDKWHLKAATAICSVKKVL